MKTLHTEEFPLFEKIKNLPVVPQKIKSTNEKGEPITVCRVSILLGRLQELTKAFSEQDYKKTDEFLKRNSLEIAWDGKFAITSDTFTFTELLKN